MPALTLLSSLALLVSAWAATAAGFTVVTLIACRRLARTVSARPAPSRFPPLVILRPCEGAEPGLDENLASSIASPLASGPAPARVFVLVPSKADPAYAIAMRVQAASPALIEVLITDVTSTMNRKAAQLAVGLEAALALDPPPEIIVQADSDVRLDPGSLAHLLSALESHPRVAAAFAAPVEPEARTTADLAASGLLSASHQDFFAIAALASLSGGTPSLAGALVAHWTTPLVETGGFSPLEGLLGEDYEVGRRLRERGYQVAISARPARCPDEHRTLATVLSRTARWLMVVRKQRPGLLLTYPFLLAPTPLLLCSSLLLASLNSLVPLYCTLGLIALRTLLASSLRRIHAIPVNVLRAFQLWWFAELLMLAAAAKALLQREVVWRGRRLKIGRGGVIEGE